MSCVKTFEFDPSQKGHFEGQEEGVASWYGGRFHGRKTASGEIYDEYGMTAAHKTVPLGTIAKVTRIDTGKYVMVKVNDRGPFVGGRIIDLSKRAAEELDMIGTGTARVRLEFFKSDAKEEFFVQIGSYRDRINADEWIQKMMRKRNDLEYSVVAKNDLYKIWVGPYAEASEADEILKDFSRMGVQGFTVKK